MHILTSTWLTTVWYFQITWRAFTSQGTMWYWHTVQSTWTLTSEVCTYKYTPYVPLPFQSVIYWQIYPIIIGTYCFLFFDGCQIVLVKNISHVVNTSKLLDQISAKRMQCNDISYELFFLSTIFLDSYKVILQLTCTDFGLQWFRCPRQTPPLWREQ